MNMIFKTTLIGLTASVLAFVPNNSFTFIHRSHGENKSILQSTDDAFENVISTEEQNLVNDLVTQGILGEKATKINSNQIIFDTMKAAETVTEAAATSAKADSLAVNDLALASSNVVESIKVSEKAVQSIIDKLSSNSNVDSSDVESLESAAISLIRVMEAAKSVALNVKNTASQDVMNLQKLESTGYSLLKTIDNVEKLSDNIESGNGILEELEIAAIDVLEEMQSSEELATEMANISGVDANSVFSLNIEVDSTIDALRFIEAGIKESITNPSPESKDVLTKFAQEALDLIKLDEINAQMVCDTVLKDAEIESITLDSLNRANIGMTELLKAAGSAVTRELETYTEQELVTSLQSIGNEIVELPGKIAEFTPLEGQQEVIEVIQTSMESTSISLPILSAIDPVFSAASDAVVILTFLI